MAAPDRSKTLDSAIFQIQKQFGKGSIMRMGLEGAKVEATIEAQIKGPKIVVFKYKPRERYRVKTGHRQKYTRLRISSIIE